jgi:hypothetical protein
MKLSPSASTLFALILAFAFTPVNAGDARVVQNDCTTTYPNKRDIPATATSTGKEALYTNPKSCEVFGSVPEIRVPALFLGVGLLTGTFCSF